MPLDRRAAYLVLWALFLVGGQWMGSRAMKYYVGPRRLLWFHSPFQFPEHFTPEGRRRIRELRTYFILAGAGTVGLTVLLNWLW